MNHVDNNMLLFGLSELWQHRVFHVQWSLQTHTRNFPCVGLIEPWLPDICDFEDGSCNWQQQADDDLDWVRQSGSSPTPNTGPDTDHTTNTPTGHYFYLPSSLADRAGQTAKLSSALYPAGETGPHFSPLYRLSWAWYYNISLLCQFVVLDRLWCCSLMFSHSKHDI